MKYDNHDAAFRDLINKALSEMMQNSDDYLFALDLELRYLITSDSVARMAGHSSAAALVGKTDYDIFPKEFADKYREDDRQVLKTGVPIVGRIEQIPGENGATRWTKTWKYPVRDADGNIVGLYGVSRDISLSMELEERSKTADDYIDLINHIPGGVGILHEQDGVVFLDFANDGCFETQHNTRESWAQYMGPRIMDVVYPPDREAVMDVYRQVREHPGKTGAASYRVTGIDGALHWVSIRFRVAYVKDGITYYYATYTGLDSQKNAEEKLKESRDALKEAMSSSDLQFFAYYPGQARGEIFATNRRLSEMPTEWSHFPDDFLAYAQASPEDAEAYRRMIRAIDRGEDEAQCLVRLSYKGVYTWEHLYLKAVRDDSGKTLRAQGYSRNVTRQKNAEEQLRKERVRLKSMDRGVFESFTFDLTRNSDPEVQTADKTMLDGEISEAALDEALSIYPPLADSNPATREILLRAAGRIPDRKDREKFITTCSGSAMRTAISEGRYSANIQYRRYVGDSLKWVSTSAEVLPDPESGDLIAFYYTKDIDEEIMRSQICEQIIGKNYACVSYLDLRSGVFRVLAGTDMDLWRLDGLRYSEALDMAEKNISGEDTEHYRRQYSLDAIIGALDRQPLYSAYTMRVEANPSAPGKAARRMKTDFFYLDDHHDRIVYLFTDVTEVFEQERESRERLKTALAAAEQASIAKTEFLSRMSHEIRTPMNAIIGLDAIALQEKGLTSSMEDHLQKIGISARFLLSLINDILDMARIESGKMALWNEPFNFEEMVNGINTILYAQCRDNGLDYECVLKSFTEERYTGDVTKLQQVLINLLGNAVKFTQRGGKVHLMIEQLSRTKEKARMRFEISDTGVGIDERFLPHLFEPFTQEERGRTSTYGGTGLGLAISKNIVSLMNGDITVHSIKNVGSEFTVEVDLGLTKDAIRRRALSKDMKPLFTLVVDDDIIVCQHTQIILNDAGLKTEYAESGADAVKKVEAQRKAHEDYDLILLDWQMPDMDGIETAREIRKIVGPEVTIIIMTAYDWADIEKKARAAGVDLFMKKPVFASSVTQAFENVLQRKAGDVQPQETEEIDFQGKRILLAEDNEINAEIAKNLLEMKGCQVETASNGAEAVESFASAPVGRYDAILMDVRMPVMDGLDATRAIRAMRKADAKTVPILAMTANAFQADINMSLEAGMNAHLTKPIEPWTLYETLKKHFK